MSAFNIPRSVKNCLNRAPAPVRDRVGRTLFRGYETYTAIRQSSKEGRLVDDGVPVPPPKLRVKVVGHADLAVFLKDGQRHNQVIRDALDRADVEAQDLTRILDWGCGCGRVVRWWRDLPDTEIYGCDYNPKLVRWVDRNLTFVDADVNALSPPLPYQTELFDFVYAISIFTHLSSELAVGWMRDIHRVLTPGGMFFFTTHGRSYRDGLSPSEFARFDDGEAVVQFSSVEGSNLCAAYHPRPWVEAKLLDGFELVELREPHRLSEPERAVLAQDRWLVRKAR